MHVAELGTMREGLFLALFFGLRYDWRVFTQRSAAFRGFCYLSCLLGGTLLGLGLWSKGEPQQQIEKVHLASINATQRAEVIDMAFPEAPRDALGKRFANGRIITGGSRRRMILFSFDDGPDWKTTPKLLEQLDHFGIKALFFVTTNRLNNPKSRRHRAQRALLHEIIKRGHMVGNHTENHPQLPLMDMASVKAEVLRSQETLTELLGERPWLFRPPGGARSPRTDQLLSNLGYTQVLWNVGTGDFQVDSADAVVRTFSRVLDRRERENGEQGGIVLMHDTYAWSIEAFPRIVAEIRSRNCELLANNEDLYVIVDDPTLFFEARREASPSELAELADEEASSWRARQDTLRALEQTRCGTLASLGPIERSDP